MVDYLRAVCLVRAMVVKMCFGDGRLVKWLGLMGGQDLLDRDARRKETVKEDEGGANICTGRRVSE